MMFIVTESYTLTEHAFMFYPSMPEVAHEFNDDRARYKEK
jgi:hypothetical protein